MGQPVDWLQPLQPDIEAWLKTAMPREGAALRMVLRPAAGLVSARLEVLPVTSNPYRLISMPHPLGARQADPSIAHKGLAGPWGTGVLSTARNLGADDGLLLWPDGSLAETAIAVVGVELDGTLVIPPPSGRVASLTERLVLPGWAESRGLRIETRSLPVAFAKEGRLWCMNALRGIWPALLL
jgi:branched-subunit amino acid aminotransferase/4-amino-4-deoxychorismate lyase